MVLEVVGVITPCPDHTKLSVRPVTTVKLLGIKFRNRRWPTTFHTIIARDADGWC
jgi:hypothetical protein